MITTVCMNPCYDKTATLSSLKPGEVNRLRDVRVDIGGKAINVAIVLRRLGVAADCIGCLGEADETTFLQLLQKENVPLSYITVPGQIRTNLKLLDDESHSVTEFNEPGPVLSPEGLEAFIALLKEKTVDSSCVVFSGRLLSGCEETTYQQCMRALSGKKCVLDAAGKSLLHGIKERPYFVKPNLPEMESIMGRELRTLRSLRDAALFLMEYGAQNVIISMGKYGAMYTNGQKTLFAPALQVKARSTVGAGDAMIGGVLMGLDKGAPMEEAFRYGIAAGAASVMTDGTQLLRPDDFHALVPKVTVQEV
ncbi:MAG: 1-phosphofructokinase family hexose kinase [Clostridia bacterium]|nr:1-phosphofructokinase family hexose kinase [Clostridia bacterium]